jgi:hypothetical protein
MLLARRVRHISLAATTRNLWLLGISVDLGDETCRRKCSRKWLGGFVVLWGGKGVVFLGSFKCKWP